MRQQILLGCLVWTVGLVSMASAQFKDVESGGSRLGESRTQQWQAGIIVTASSGNCTGIVGTAPIPIDWPEQRVTIVEEEVSPSARITYRMAEGTVKQMVVTVRTLSRGQQAKALITLEIERNTILPPEQTDVYQIPDSKKISYEIRKYLGISPLIESTNARIRTLAKEIGTEEETAWEHVEAIYDWVREKVEYRNGPLKGALAALDDGFGDAEDVTSLFIAICRAAAIPARTVWVPGHVYPEFYLVDADGEGHWFPCQAAGTRAFGEIPELRPILQKGDNFRMPNDRRQKVRFMPETLDGTGGRPRVQFIRKLL